jgi:D-alanine-D-alanine ligase-like ATP-grasp enzyme
MRSSSSIILFEKARLRGYEPQWLTEYGMFQFLVDGKTKYAYQTKNFGNNQLCCWLTGDKHATHVFLEKNNLPTTPYYYGTQKNQLNIFFDKYHPVVAKPVHGEKSEGVVLINDRKQLLENELSTTIFEKFIDGIEYRYLMLENKLVAVQKKVLKPAKNYPWRKEFTNLDLNDYDLRLSQMADKINYLMPQKLLAIDFIVDDKDTIWVLELNSMPGLWSLLHPDFGEPIDLSDKVLDLIIKTQ